MYEFHEIANIFPSMEDQEFDELKRDIKEHGLREPIYLYQGKIIDGRNRYQACIEVGMGPHFKEWEGNGSLVAFVVSMNLHRRHLTSSQKAVIALDVEREFAKEAEGKECERKTTFPKMGKSFSSNSWRVTIPLPSKLGSPLAT